MAETLVSKLKPVATWSHETIADGSWMQANTLGPLKENVITIAEAMDNAGVADLPTIKTNAEAGYAAYVSATTFDWTGVRASAQQGAQAYKDFQPWKDKMAGIEASSKSGAEALGKLNGYDLAAIQASAKSGWLAYNKIKDVDLNGIINSAKSGKAAFDYLSPKSATLNDFISKLPGISASALSGVDAMKMLNSSASRWNTAADKLTQQFKTVLQNGTVFTQRSTLSQATGKRLMQMQAHTVATGTAFTQP